MKRIYFAMIIVGLFFIGAGGFLIFPAQTRAEEFNPFKPQLPAKTISVGAGGPDIQQPPPERFTREVNIQGVVWDTDRPQAVIEGRVYSEGDRIDEIDAAIIEINREGITIEYQGCPYFLKKRTAYSESFHDQPR